MKSQAELMGEVEQLRQQLEFVSRREDLLTRIEAATRGLTDPAEITLTAATLLGQHLQVNRCAYADVEADQDTFNLFGNYTNGAPSVVGRYTFTQFSVACLRAMRAGEAFVVEDAETDPRIVGELESFHMMTIRSVICVPLIKNGVFSAAMAVHCTMPRVWRPEEVTLMFSVAARCWESIERARVLRALEVSQERLRLSQIAGKAGTFEWYIPQNIVIWTPELERLYGVASGTFEGGFEDWVKRVHPDDSKRITEEIQQVLGRRQLEYGYDFRAFLPDGSERWLHGQAHFLYAPDGSPSRMIGINVDIHDRRIAEDALIRTEKLAAVGRLATSIAHEINNPLEAVTNLLYLARHNEDMEEIHSFLNVADMELRRMSLITNQTLRFHRQSTSATEVTCSELFTGVLGIYQGRLVNSNIAVFQEVRAEKPFLCFEGEIRQVLNNLIGNAIDAMAAGGKLCLRAHESRVTGRDGVRMTVADTGPGIAKSNLAKVFEPFFTTKGFNGTGLGLWVSHEIAARHGGSLNVRSKQGESGHGTVFSLFLPYAALAR